MGLGKGLGRTLRRLSDFFYRVPKLLRCSSRLELRLVWRSPARSGQAQLDVEGREGERKPALGTWFGMGTAICKLPGKITQQVKRRSAGKPSLRSGCDRDRRALHAGATDDGCANDWDGGCKYTCHPQCRSRVSLDCHQSGPATQSQDHLNNNRNSSVRSGHSMVWHADAHLTQFCNFL
ncbi:hypothetical protein SKAU_G00027560 [Synaphobranchus kaupii]|uniref:Uncharacterized protein n=1 Tax=Synaphobranchus kaupii TaxID=118154 RepID=A0A9Q1GE96_SYNKA|nr:hypothetical protein SKAU_G00027560 [Synaphobranchus kaupii]